jgi:hypothetical protein
VLYRLATLAGLFALAFFGDTARAADPAARPVPAYDQSAIARRGFFMSEAVMSVSPASN